MPHLNSGRLPQASHSHRPELQPSLRVPAAEARHARSHPHSPPAGCTVVPAPLSLSSPAGIAAEASEAGSAGRHPVPGTRHSSTDSAESLLPPAHVSTSSIGPPRRIFPQQHVASRARQQGNQHRIRSSRTIAPEHPLILHPASHLHPGLPWRSPRRIWFKLEFSAEIVNMPARPCHLGNAAPQRPSPSQASLPAVTAAAARRRARRLRPPEASIQASAPAHRNRFAVSQTRQQNHPTLASRLPSVQSYVRTPSGTCHSDRPSRRPKRYGSSHPCAKLTSPGDPHEHAFHAPQDSSPPSLPAVFPYRSPPRPAPPSPPCSPPTAPASPPHRSLAGAGHPVPGSSRRQSPPPPRTSPPASPA